jgi:hypothetical protein
VDYNRHQDTTASFVEEELIITEQQTSSYILESKKLPYIEVPGIRNKGVCHSAQKTPTTTAPF